jgi:hypothetical protein
VTYFILHIHPYSFIPGTCGLPPPVRSQQSIATTKSHLLRHQYPHKRRRRHHRHDNHTRQYPKPNTPNQRHALITTISPAYMSPPIFPLIPPTLFILRHRNISRLHPPASFSCLKLLIEIVYWRVLGSWSTDLRSRVIAIDYGIGVWWCVVVGHFFEGDVGWGGEDGHLMGLGE